MKKEIKAAHVDNYKMIKGGHYYDHLKGGIYYRKDNGSDRWGYPLVINYSKRK